jgi:oligosaccharide translocation protein RFT1
MALSMAWVTTRGACGLIAADAANMALRIAYSLHFARQHFEGVPSFAMRAMLPSTPTLVALATSSLVTALSNAVLMEEEAQPAWQKGFRQVASGGWSHWGAGSEVGFGARAGLHVAVGAVCFLGTAWVGYKGERQTLAEIRRLRAHQD